MCIQSWKYKAVSTLAARTGRLPKIQTNGPCWECFEGWFICLMKNCIYPVWFIKGAVPHECWSTGHKTPVYLLIVLDPVRRVLLVLLQLQKNQFVSNPPPSPCQGGKMHVMMWRMTHMHTCTTQAVFFSIFYFYPVWHTKIKRKKKQQHTHKTWWRQSNWKQKLKMTRPNEENWQQISNGKSHTRECSFSKIWCSDLYVRNVLRPVSDEQRQQPYLQHCWWGGSVVYPKTIKRTASQKHAHL